ncbi:OLC1v1003777C1 [Oldenlandia corymbosa var. corymbosa]|uniref:OLC1v1003777C1 n=1 Tax=Oldenlandia corymbosa var. corymbosa TaxID=529605 RepID=A0AAV1DDT0_OLDCO|nr:OLC1v1003777C1 [Oldenlandia corymbosa var. corymbosa]
MTGYDDPLDLEFEEPLNFPPALANKKKKVIGLDDLLADYYEEKSKVVEREAKRAKKKAKYDSDEDMDEREKEFHDQVDEIEKTMGHLSGDEDAFVWGLQVFGNQESFPPLQVDEIESCELLQCVRNDEVNSMVGLEAQKGATFLEGLLKNGWLLNLVSTRHHLESPIAAWTFYLMLYSPNEVLRRNAYDFWSGVLRLKDKAGNLRIKLNWLPNYHQLKRAIEIYGFGLDVPARLSSDVGMDATGSESPGPPQNIRYWIKYASVCFQVRETWQILSTSEAEDLTFVVITLFLDRVLSGLSICLHECLIAAVSYFKDDEWQASSQKIAENLASRLPNDVNCLRVVESISGVDARSKHLRSAVAFQFLLKCFEKKQADAEEILELLTSTNVKDKSSDFYKMYVHLSLAENWLLYDLLLKNKPVICQMWGLCLRNFSCNISSTDMRSHASKELPSNDQNGDPSPVVRSSSSVKTRLASICPFCSVD